MSGREHETAAPPAAQSPNDVKMAALLSGTFRLHFNTVGVSGDTSSIFIDLNESSVRTVDLGCRLHTCFSVLTASPLLSFRAPALSWWLWSFYSILE